jgi:catechol 2,3-dioxygenase-like lactoylglutathione lyase family enzyme
MAPTIEKISAITFRVINMKVSVQFYGNVLGMELLNGGERASFSSPRANDSASAILNLEQGDSIPQWGRLIFHVTDVDAFWAQPREKGFDPEIPRDAPWGERYFHSTIRMATSCRLLGRNNEWAQRTSPDAISGTSRKCA